MPSCSKKGKNILCNVVKYFSMAFAILLSNSIISEAAVIFSRVNPNDGYVYALLGVSNGSEYDSISWTAAEAEAVSLGGHLATIHDDAENAWIQAAMTTNAYNRSWIGLNNAAPPGTWVWANGEPVAYTNWDWSMGYPTNWPGRNYATIVRGTGTWANYSNTQTYHFGAARTGEAITRFDWNQSSFGDFSEGSNWSPSGPPSGSSAGAYFAVADACEVAFPDHATTRLLAVGGGGVTFYLSGYVYNAGDTYVGYADGQFTSLSLSYGTLNSSYSSVGDVAGSEGSVDIGGYDTTWNTESKVYIGNAGSGWLNIHEGGQLNAGSLGLGVSEGGYGQLTLTGYDSVLTLHGGTINGPSALDTGNFVIGNYGNGFAEISDSAKLIVEEGYFVTVGYAGNGTLNITGGAQVSAGILSTTISKPGTYGDVTISGAGSSMTLTNYASIGNAGSGTLNILDGGYFSADSLTMTTANGWESGVVTVSGEGSCISMQDGGQITVGEEGNGRLTVENSGRVTTSSLYIGVNGDSQGHVIVDGINAELVVDFPGAISLGIDASSSGTLEIKNGGRCNVGVPVISIGVGGTGALTVTGLGSMLYAFSQINVGENGTGNLTIDDDGAVSTGAVWIARDSEGTGTLDLNGGSLHLDGGWVAIGQGGTLNANGGMLENAVQIQNDGALNILASSQFVGSIAGLGNTTVAFDAQLTATSITQNSLTIGGVLYPVQASSVRNSSPVPEPTALLLLGTLGLAAFFAWFLGCRPSPGIRLLDQVRTQGISFHIPQHRP